MSHSPPSKGPQLSVCFFSLRKIVRFFFFFFFCRTLHTRKMVADFFVKFQNTSAKCHAIWHHRLVDTRVRGVPEKGGGLLGRDCQRDSEVWLNVKSIRNKWHEWYWEAERCRSAVYLLFVKVNQWEHLTVTSTTWEGGRGVEPSRWRGLEGAKDLESDTKRSTGNLRSSKEIQGK